MSTHLRKHLPTLQVIAAIKAPTLRVKVLKEFSHDKSFLQALKEIAKNTVNRKLKLTEKQKKILRKESKAIINLTKIKHRRHRKYAEQSGRGFFLPIAIPIVAEIISKLINNG